MTKMLNCASLPSYERFQCLFTISSIFRGQGDALTIDRKEFYQHLYGALENWKPDTVKEKETNKADVRGSSFKDGSRHLGISLVHVCHQMLCETKTSDFGRLASFTKRMLSIGMHQETGLMMGLLSLTNKLIVKYRRLRILMEGESETPIHGTVYDPSNDDPSLAGGLLTSLWEITQLRKHYHPHVSQVRKTSIQNTKFVTGCESFLEIETGRDGNQCRFDGSGIVFRGRSARNRISVQHPRRNVLSFTVHSTRPNIEKEKEAFVR